MPRYFLGKAGMVVIWDDESVELLEEFNEGGVAEVEEEEDNLKRKKKGPKFKKDQLDSEKKKIDKLDELDIKEALADDVPVSELADKYGVSKQTIYNLKKKFEDVP